jgi:hypothetical protein
MGLPSFDQNAFLNMFQMIAGLQRAKAEEEHRKEVMQLEKQTLQHRIRELDLGEKHKNFSNKMDLLKAMQGMTAPDIEGPPTEQQAQAGVQPSAKLSPVDFSGLSEVGVPEGTQITPQSMQELLAQRTQERMNQARAAREGNQIDLPPDVAEKLGMKGGQIDPSLLPFLATKPEQSTEIAPGVASDIVGPKGGKFSKSELELLGEQAKLRTQRDIAREANKTKVDLKGPAGHTPEQVQPFVDRLNGGQIKFSEVPKEYKAPVLEAMGRQGKAILTPTMETKLDQFFEAQSAINKVKQDLESFSGGSWSAPIEKVKAGYQLKADVDGLTRMIGRAMGEKGVFTDQDKADFAKILSPGLVVSAMAPDVAKSRIQQLDEFLGGIKRKRLGMYQSRAGGSLPGGDTGAGGGPSTAEDYLKSIGH